MGAPSFPTGSLYAGTIPAFPTTTYNWGFWFFGTYEGFSISIPNITQIPEWIASLLSYAVLWAVGWIGAIALYLGEAIDYYTTGPITSAVDFLFTEFNSTLFYFEWVSRFAGPFSIDVAALLMGILLLIIVVGTFYMIKGLTALIGGM